jgi:imidazolonepropionase-like amidohydrolase
MQATLKSWPKVRSPADAEGVVQLNLRNSADYIKILHENGAALGKEFPSFPTDSISAVVSSAHSHNRVCVAHATNLKDALDVLHAGVDGTMHSIYDQAPTRELVEAYQKNNAFNNPTLAVTGSLTTEGKDIAEMFADDDRVETMIDDHAREHMCKCLGMSKKGGSVEFAYESVKMLKKAGIDIIW